MVTFERRQRHTAPLAPESWFDALVIDGPHEVAERWDGRRFIQREAVLTQDGFNAVSAALAAADRPAGWSAVRPAVRSKGRDLALDYDQWQRLADLHWRGA